MINPYASPEEVAGARKLLDDVVRRCTVDRWAEFPKEVRQRFAQGSKLPGIVLMGLDKYILDEHLRFVDSVLASNPGLQIRAVVSDSVSTIENPELIKSREWPFLTTKEFFEQAARFSDCVVVDRYCTWMPTIKYKAQLRRLGLPVLRFEQFMNMPDINPVGAYFKTQSDFMLEHLDEILELASLFEDDKSRKVLYNVLAGFISMNYVYFALSCDDHRERYFSSDVGFEYTDREVLADVGALDGSESIIFSEMVGRKFKGIHAFEPEKNNFRKLCRKVNNYVAEHGALDIYCHNFGVYDRNDYLSFTGTDYTVTVSEARAKDGEGLLMARLDDVLDDMTYLRLEAEGSEAAALRGGTGLIKAFKPKLAVSVYHRPDDFLVLPKMIREFDKGYRYKLRHQSLEYGVLCMYCQ